MIMKRCLVSPLVIGAAGVIYMSAVAEASRMGQSPVATARTIEPYRTQLFNLLSKDDNVVDGHNYYQGGFDKQFDALLASSRLAKADKTRIPLKKRLLSGPAPEPALRTDPTSGTQWIVYDACQAHRCDEIALCLLYDPTSRRMVGKLNLDKRFEFLGAPSAGEQRLLGQAR